jgi:glycosyltransferase involved in cell wall biosynthesis
VEVIVVDDGSDSGAESTPQLDDPRVRFVRHPQRRGVAAARNSGIEVASARWLAFLDDDDVWAPHRLRSMLDAIAASSADFGFCAAVVVDEAWRPLMLQPVAAEKPLLHALLQRNVIPGGGSNVVAKVALVERTGGFDESYSFIADWDMWIRLANRGRPAPVPDVLIAYSHHAGSWVVSGDTAVSQDLKRLVEKHDALSRQFGVTFDVPEYHRYVAYSLWLAGRRREAAQRYLAVARDYRDPASVVRAGGALLERDFVARLRPSQRRPPCPEWLKHAQGSEAA